MKGVGSQVGFDMVYSVVGEQRGDGVFKLCKAYSSSSYTNGEKILVTRRADNARRREAYWVVR